ncbi:SRPBCC family protein [Sporichthya sp.]|uniref:SRPBCC family protein n=1 Tax=Sporichthya sp. TaxID=65475 RepID=UPI0017ABAC84|nr:SRPBCC family protein [Sporichthya sp.]MBA3743167.1 SRPBCC family protein [Sporichthya sp.]
MNLTEHLSDANRGTYLEVKGRPALRFRRNYPHPVERVWAAVSTPAGLKNWFPGQVTLEPWVDGAMTFDMDPNAPAGTGKVLTWQPPTRFSFTWHDDEVHLTLEADGSNCVFTLTNVLSEKDGAARNGAGWSVCLGELTRHLDGVPGTDPNEAGTDLWQPLFEAYAAAGLPSGATLPS